MKVKLKICDGCRTEKMIWKNHQGNRYCKYCWYKMNTVTGNETKPMNRKPIAPRSTKRAAQERQYLKLRKAYLLSSPTCKAKLPNICTQLATDVHHKKGRMGSLLTDLSHFLPVCRPCHNWIELNPKEAKELGYSINRI